MTPVNSLEYAINSFVADSYQEEKENVQELISMDSTNVLSEVKTYKLSEFINRLNDALAAIDDTKEAKFVVKEESQQTTIELLNCPQEFSQVYFELRKEIDDDFIGDFFNELEDMEYSFAQQLREEYNLQEHSDEIGNTFDSSSEEIIKAEEPISGFGYYYDLEQKGGQLRNKFYFHGPSDETSRPLPLFENNSMSNREKVIEICKFVNYYNEIIGQLSSDQMKSISYEYKNGEICFNLETSIKVIPNFLRIDIDDFKDIESFSQILENKLEEIVNSLPQSMRIEEMFSEHHLKDDAITQFLQTPSFSDEEKNLFLDENGFLVEIINSDIIDSDRIDFTKPNIFCNFNLENVISEISFLLSSINNEIFENLSFGIFGGNLCFRFGKSNYFLEIPSGDVCSEISFKQLFSIAILQHFNVDVMDLLAISF